MGNWRRAAATTVAAWGLNPGHGWKGQPQFSIYMMYISGRVEGMQQHMCTVEVWVVLPPHHAEGRQKEPSPIRLGLLLHCANVPLPSSMSLGAGNEVWECGHQC
ncbi:hypothetical protein ABPG75_002948 [Micractinium tetrahymenae]